MSFHISLFFIILCVAVGAYANVIGKNFWVWAGVSVLITPFLASLILLILATLEKKSDKASA